MPRPSLCLTLAAAAAAALAWGEPPSPPAPANPESRQTLAAELDGLRAGYVGIAYRVLVRIDEDNRVVRVMRIAHRADVYRPE